MAALLPTNDLPPILPTARDLQVPGRKEKPRRVRAGLLAANETATGLLRGDLIGHTEDFGERQQRHGQSVHDVLRGRWIVRVIVAHVLD